MKRRRLLARLADEQIRYVYCIGQAGAGSTTLLEQALAVYGPGAICVMPAWDELAVDEAEQYRAFAAGYKPKPGQLLVARATNPAAPSPFAGIPPSQVCFFNDGDLAFTVGEIEELLAGVPHSPEFAQFAYDATFGLPASCAFIRRVLASEGEAAARDLTGTSYAPLKRYLYERQIAPLPHDELAVLISAAALNDTDESVLRDVLPATDVHACIESLCARRMLQHRGNDLIIRPMLRMALEANRGADLKRYAAGSIEALVDSGDLFSAARIAIDAGRAQEAAGYVARLPADDLILSRPALSDVLRRLPTELLAVNPRLWMAASFLRYFEVDTEIMLAEVEALLSYWSATEDPRVVKALHGAKAYLHLHGGDFESAEEELQALYPGGLPQPAEATRADAFVLGAFAYGLVQRGNLVRAAELVSVLSLMTDVPFVGYVMTLLNIRRSRYAGNWKAQRAFLEQFAQLARNRTPVSQARAFHELAQGALAAGDTEALDAARASLREIAQSHDIGPFEAYAAVAGSPAQHERRFGTPQQRAQMHLLEAYYAGSSEESRLCLASAMEEADISVGYFERILVRVALAELLPHRRQALIAEAKNIAADFGSRELDNALAHLAIGELPPQGQAMRPFAQHFRDQASRVNEEFPVAVHAASATVQRAGTPIHVSRRVFDLLLALAVRNRPVERDELCEMLWPDQLPAEAANALKMTVRRARLQTGDPSCVQVTQNRYTLGAHVACDFRDLRTEFEPLLSDRNALRARRDEVLDFVRSIARGMPPHLSEFEWFVGTAAGLQNLAITASSALARMALDNGDLEWGSQLAAAMIEADPCDELAWEITIRALRKQGDAAGAARAYREYVAHASAAGVSTRDADARFAPILKA